MTLEARIFSSIGEIDPVAWDICFPGEAENHAYCAACARGWNRDMRNGAAFTKADRLDPDLRAARAFAS
jgi:hypothetical protein